MAVNILQKYGIKEVADVTFYEIKTGDNGLPAPGAPVLYLDTLKVSTIEQTAENTSARGGKGNPELVTWDYNKEITLTLEDALFSAKSLALMYGVNPGDETEFSSAATIYRTLTVAEYNEIFEDVDSPAVDTEISIKGTKFKLAAVPVWYNEKGWKTEDGKDEGTALTKANGAYCVLELKIGGTEIKIGADNFPGTYYVTGDTYARSAATGDDEFFQFIVPKAKMLSEVTLTMEADGDPATFNMSMKVLRPDAGPMMKLVKYGAVEADG